MNINKVFRIFVLWLILSLPSLSVVFAQSGDEAERLWELGVEAFENKRYSDALSYYEKSLAKCSGDMECISANLNNIGLVYEELGKYEKAITYYEEALTANRKMDSSEGIAINSLNIGALYYQSLKQYSNAMPYLEESLRIYKGLNQSGDIALVLHHIGAVNIYLGQYHDALSNLEESLKINRRLNVEEGIGANLHTMGWAYSRMGQNEKAITYYEEALKIRRRLDRAEDTASTLNSMGSAYHDLHKYEKALFYYKEALKIRRQNNLLDGIAVSLTNIGALYHDFGQYDNALSNYQESLEISKGLSNPASIATNLNNIGNTYSSLGQYDKALSYYQEALKIEEGLNRPLESAHVFNNIGMVYYNLGNYNQALPYLEEALRIDKKLGNPAEIAARLNNIGSAYLFQKRYKEAEEVFLERRRLAQAIKGIRLRHGGLAEVYIATKRYDDAISLLKEIPPHWRDNDSFLIEFYTQHGRALKGKGMLQDASHELLKAVSLIEGTRKGIREKGGFLAGGVAGGRFRSYHALVEALLERVLSGENKDPLMVDCGTDLTSCAFYFAELTKARSLLDAVTEAARKTQKVGIPEGLKEKEQSILNQMSAIDAKWESALIEGEHAVKELKDRRQGLSLELDGLINEFRLGYPGYASLYYPRPMRPEELPLRDDEVVIEYASGDNSWYVFVIRKGKVSNIHKIDIRKEMLEEKIKAFMEPFNTMTYSGFSVKTAAGLYEILLSEALKDVRDDEKVVIIPDGILGLLPFDALVVKEGKDYKDSLYTGDKWTITYAQSATTFALTRMLKPSQAEKQLFALGNPIYDKADPRYTAYMQGKPQTLIAQNLSQYAYRGITVVPKAGEGGKWEEVVYMPLPETEDELKEIAKLFGVKTEPPDVLLSITANETSLRNIPLKDYRYIHFATHADLPGKVQGIKEPFIILGQVDNKGSDDGFLTLSEALELTLDADMVVLSACSTGRGRIIAGEGVASFARAFQHAGAKSVVVSLWEVPSNAAVEFMKTFYGYLKAGKGRAESLKLARKEIKAKYPNPFYWAVFILYGEG